MSDRVPGDGPPVQERRRGGRIETDVACVVDGKSKGSIRSLSLGGALVLAPNALARMNQALSVTFKVRSKEPATFVGRVFHVTPAATNPNTAFNSSAWTATSTESWRLASNSWWTAKAPGTAARPASLGERW